MEIEIAELAGTAQFFMINIVCFLAAGAGAAIVCIRQAQAARSKPRALSSTLREAPLRQAA
jgi:hypothetical protein